jgi:AcrR family transcriptional regulator
MAEAPDSTETRILDTAAFHLRRDGLDRMRVVAVAHEIGISHANVYRYFPSKEALADAVIGRWVKDIERQMLAAAGSPDPAPDKLERMLVLLAQGYRLKLQEDPALFKVFAAAAAEERMVARRHRTRIRELLERALDEGLSSGAYTASRQALTAFAFDGAYRFIHPVAVNLDANAPDQSLRQRRDQTIESVVLGLRRLQG